MATIRYFAAAADAAGTDTEQRPAETVGELLDGLRDGRDERFARVLQRCSLLVDGVRVDDPTTPLGAEARVDVLPPFAGG